MPAPPAPPDALAPARALLAFIDQSPTPWHAAHNAAAWLECAGYRRLDERARWTLAPGDRAYLLRDDSALVAVRVGHGSVAEHGYRLVAAHTDSPALRVKANGAQARAGVLTLGVEVYGSPILATFTDRDLGLAGRVVVRDGAALSTRLVRLPGPMARLPNVAIHLNRKVNEDGLRVNAQSDGNAVLETLGALPPADRLHALLAAQLDVDPAAIAGFELVLFDAQPGTLYGPDGQFIASRQLDNLGSCHAALDALTASIPGAASAVVALFDHEEVGSESHRGAASSLLPGVLERIGRAQGLDAEDRARALAASFLVSTDMAHAVHPSRADLHDPGHTPQLNAGPVLKLNAAQRYATEALSGARFRAACERAGVPCQTYVHRADMHCGTTVGPLLAARLGVTSVDAGNPMWAMHSARESAGALDPGYLGRVLAVLLSE